MRAVRKFLTVRGVVVKAESGPKEYGQYIVLNASWLIGSAGTLMLDLMIFGQFWIYRHRKPERDMKGNRFPVTLGMRHGHHS